MDAEPGRWVEDPILPEIDPANPHAPPPPELIDVHGAQPVRVYTIDAPDPRRRNGFAQALILAWAPRIEGGWGVADRVAGRVAAGRAYDRRRALGLVQADGGRPSARQGAARQAARRAGG